eukprot:CCRYP_011977-RA/>CCRYP_011977-RA protein AED:0.47 eAED:1.00 QI:0/-1/0/1/-1/0/1/0/77
MHPTNCGGTPCLLCARCQQHHSTQPECHCQRTSASNTTHPKTLPTASQLLCITSGCCRLLQSIRHGAQHSLRCILPF